jgi:alpha-1,3-rhamnosyltransferase
LVLDDGSKDGSIRILQDLSRRSPVSMQVIFQENTGNIAKNMNKLIKLAKGKYVSFISGDDILTENSINEKVKLLESDDFLCFVVSKRFYKINEFRTIIKESLQGELVPSLTADDLLNLEYEKFHSFFIQNAVFRKDVINYIGGFDENMTGDDIVLRIRIFFYLKNNPNMSFIISDTFGFYYRLHSNNLHKNSIRQVKTIVEVLDTFFPDRPTPELFIGLVRYCVRSIGRRDAGIIFTFSDRCIKIKEKVLKYYNIKRPIALFILMLKKTKIYCLVKERLNFI